MAISISVEVFGDVQMDHTLENYSERADGLEVFFHHFVSWFHSHEKKQFDSEGFASGGWAPLSAKYAAQKAIDYPGRGILERTGHLKQSLTSEFGNIFGHGIVDMDSHQVFVGTDIDYARYHQHGTVKMPQRRPVELREQDRREIGHALQKFLTRKEGDPAPFPGIPFEDPFGMPKISKRKLHGRLFDTSPGTDF